MSFFDEGDEPSTTRRARPRPSGGGRPPRAPSRRPPDGQAVRQRQIIAGVVVLVVLILLVFGINSCRDSARTNALRDYNTKVGTIATASDDLGRQFFSVLARQSLQPLDQQTQVNQLRVRAQQQAQQARDLSTPGEMAEAQRNLVLALDLRSDAVGKVATRISAARGDQESAAAAATQQITGEMQAFLASDVVYAQRVVPFISEALSGNGIGGQRIVGARFMDDITWLQPSTVASRLGASAGGGTSNQQVAPGRHGHGLDSVAIGDTTLQPSPATNRITAAANLAFTVNFTNQGENVETGVRVRVRVRPPTGKVITVTRTIDQTNPGATAQATIPLGQTPPKASTTVEVEVLKVPGESNVANNTQQYTVLFGS